VQSVGFRWFAQKAAAKLDDLNGILWNVPRFSDWLRA
jgi:acylphosphatase